VFNRFTEMGDWWVRTYRQAAEFSFLWFRFTIRDHRYIFHRLCY